MNVRQCLLTCALLALCGRAQAHPVAQGALQITIIRERIVVHARISVEEVVVSSSLRVDDSSRYHSLSQAYAGHGEYFLKHFFLAADGVRLEGKVLRVTEPAGKNGAISPLDTEKEFVLYEMEFALQTPPRKIEIRQDLLNEINYTPGNPWEAAYILRIGQHEQPAREGILLASRTPVTFECDWEKGDAQSGTPELPSSTPAVLPPSFPMIPEPAHSPIPGGWKGWLAGVLLGILATAAIWLAAKKLKGR